MSAYALRRLLWMLPTLIGITLCVFVAVHAAPGDPATLTVAGHENSEASVDFDARAARFREEHLLDQPLWKQYLHFLGPFDLSRDGHAWFGGSGVDPWHGVLALDFGREFHRPNVTVAQELARRLAVSVPLALCAILLCYAVAIPLGVASALSRGSWFDRVATSCLFLLHSAPVFWAGLMLILLFGETGLGWLPVLGLHDKDAAEFGAWRRAWDTAAHALLPVLTLSLAGLAYLSRQMRAGMLEVVSQDYVRTARAKGLSPSRVVWKHALPNALIPVITLFASVFPALIGGSVIVETVFGIPGMGRYAYEGLLARDYNIIMATTTLSAVMTLVGILVSDLLYGWVDPRIRYG